MGLCLGSESRATLPRSDYVRVDDCSFGACSSRLKFECRRILLRCFVPTQTFELMDGTASLEEIALQRAASFPATWVLDKFCTLQ